MRRIAMFLAALVLGVSSAAAQTVGLFADPAGTDCSLEIPFPGNAVTAYLIVTIDGPATDGVLFGGFRIDGLPDGWSVTVESIDPEAVVGGDLFVEGIAFAYPDCATGRRILQTLSIQPTSAVENVTLAAAPHALAPGCGFEGGRCTEDFTPCPNLCGCGELWFPCFCLTPVPSTINGGPCVVSTEASTWGWVKHLYR